VKAGNVQSIEGPIINPSALEPLYAPWEEPNAHRVRVDKPGEHARVVKGRRPSTIQIVQNLRSAVREWRESFYAGVSDTTQQLLNHWFERPHRVKSKSGEESEFRYYYCQREAIETFIYLKEFRTIDRLSQLVYEYGGPDKEIAALGITEEEDSWSRYAFKIATGAGKTKVMSLAIVWSFFHALRESDSPMALHFVIIAPNLTVYERLKEDFGDGKIFDTDPLIPPEWRGDWNMSVVLQGGTSGAVTGGVIYLTNIHRLYDPKKKRKKDNEMYSFAGPNVSRASALDTGAELRDRITAHRRIMVLNDESHHVWDPDSAWNEAITYLHETLRARNGYGIMAQLDFSATPKDNKGQLFKHIICDTPLGEAVDGGIVKTPIIGKASQSLTEEASDNAAYKYDRHIRLGYERWKKSVKEWEKSGKKCLLFVMCENTESANQIATRLNTDPTFSELNGKTINLHTNLKGKLKKIGKGADSRVEFVENEKEISDDDLKKLRKLSRELDENKSPYFCIVSVLMLREGWDVRNVTTIVPLRPYSSKANILPEQTLGRGLRRMTPPGTQGANEIVSVVEHPAFASLYQQELAQEGLLLEIIDVEHIPSTTVSIYPDEGRKDLNKFKIEVPVITAGHRIIPVLNKLIIQDIRNEFKKYKPLPLGEKGTTEIDYEGRHLFTGEIVEKMTIHLPLLESGIGAVSYYVKQLEQICKLRGLHTKIAPLLQVFFEEILFKKKTTLFEPELITRLGEPDVAEHVRAVFVPLIRERTTSIEERIPAGEPMRLVDWKPYQVTHSERRQALEAQRTLFNLVPCNRALEVAMTRFADHASDVAAFAKNAGPQCLRIDYLSRGYRLAFYTPDFFIRLTEGTNYLVETKGREDSDVPRKARAAMAWCEAASKSGQKWEYLYVPHALFERMTGNTISELARTSLPALQNLISEEDLQQLPLFAGMTFEEKEGIDLSDFVDKETFEFFPPRYKKAIEDAIALYHFLEKKEGALFSPVFSALLGVIDESAKGLILRKLQPALPNTIPEQKSWLSPYLGDVDRRQQHIYNKMSQNLKRTLVFRNGFSPLGLLRSCLDYALNDHTKIGGIFEEIKVQFRIQGARKLLETVSKINDFRNSYVAHQENELTDLSLTQKELKVWIEGMKILIGT